jgi:serine/threonine-protein kinase RsbW
LLIKLLVRLLGAGVGHMTSVNSGQPSGAHPQDSFRGGAAAILRSAQSSGGVMAQDAAADVDVPLRDVVTVRIPATGAYLAVLRTATAGLAARLDFTLDEIEDLRMAVDEACALLLANALAGTDLTCAFELAGGGLRIAVTVASHDGVLPRRDTFAWTVLTALAGGVDARVDAENRVTIELHKQRGAAAGAADGG